MDAGVGQDLEVHGDVPAPGDTDRDRRRDWRSAERQLVSRSAHVAYQGVEPVLVIHGTGPSIMSTTRVDELMPALPSARLVEMPEGGHLILMEAPQQVAKVVKEFLHGTPRQAT